LAVPVTQVVLATGEGNLVYLEVRGGAIEQKGHVKLDAEVSCVDASPLADEAEAATLVAVGTWDMQA
jgi:DNA damage-binding protein 1